MSKRRAFMLLTTSTALALASCAGTQEHAEPPEGVAGVTTDSASSDTVDNANPTATGEEKTAADGTGDAQPGAEPSAPSSVGSMQLSGAPEAGANPGADGSPATPSGDAKPKTGKAATP